jgi:hypothetical protein
MWHSAFLLTLFLLPMSGDPPKRPPKLTLDKYVDYVAWYNDSLNAGNPADNAQELYRSFWPPSFTKVEESAVPEIPQVVAEQLKKAKYGTWTKKQYPELVAWIGEARPYMQVLRKAPERRGLWLVHPRESIVIASDKLMDPICSRSRIAAQAMLADAWLKRSDRKERLIETFRVVLANASHLKQGRTVVSWLSGTAQESMGYGAIRAAFSGCALSEEETTTIYALLQKPSGVRVSLADVLICTWGMDLAGLQLYSPGARIERDRWVAANRDEDIPPSFDEADFDLAETERLVDGYYARVVEIVSKPLDLPRVKQIAEYEAKIAPDVERNNFARPRKLGQLTRTCQLTLRAETARRGTLVTIAVLTHHFEHGEWPATLSKVDKKLRPKSYKELCIDPCSGKDFVYRLKDGEPLLYSIGMDGKDDGGRYDEHDGESEGGGDKVFLPYHG